MTPPEIEGYSDLVQVARGGFGIVYRARQARFDRIVALKVLAVADLTERDRQRFDRECRAMGSLSWHPNVVAVHDSGITVDGHPYLVMEYLPAGSMADRLRDGPYPWPDVVRAGVQVAGALGAAHAAGVLHRDLKPENLLVGPFGEAELADFGIAAIEGSSATITGHASLTVAHVAPELLAGERPDERSDLYGLGSTLHTLVAGRPPFSRESGEPVATVITRVLREPAPRAPGVPDGLADLLLRCLAKDPGQRPPTAAALGRALQEIQEAEGVPVTELRLAATAEAPDVPASDLGGAAPGDEASTRSVAVVPPVPAPPSAAPVPNTPATASPSPPTLPVAVVAAGPAPAPEPPEPPAPTPEVSPVPASRAGRGRLVAAAVVVLAALVIGVAAVLLTGGDDGGGGGAGGGEAESAAAVTATIDVDPTPVGIAATDEAIWVAHTETAGTVTRIDPATNDVIATIPVGDTPRGVAATADAVWVANFGGGTVSRIDPTTNQVVATVEAGSSPRGVAASDDQVWVTNFDDATATRIDPATNAVVATVTVGAGPIRAEIAGDAVWITNNDGGSVSRIDPATNEVVATVPIGGGALSTTATAGAVWVSAFQEGTVTRIDPTTNEVAATIDLVKGVAVTAASSDSLWVANSREGTVTRVRLADDGVLETIEVGDGATGVSVAGNAVWVTATGADLVARVEPAAG